MKAYNIEVDCTNGKTYNIRMEAMNEADAMNAFFQICRVCYSALQ